MSPPLQGGVCAPEDWFLGDWHNCVFDPVPSLIGEPAFGMIVGGAVFVGLYFAGNGRMATPTAITVLLATTLFPLLPGDIRGIAWTVLFIGAVAAGIQVMQKYVLNPSTT
jgi:hypothetical protein